MKKWIGREKEKIGMILLAGVLLLVIAVPTEPKEKQQQLEYRETAAVPESVSEEALLESRLEKILSTVAGIGEVQVMITFKSNGKRVIEKDERRLTSDAGEDSGTKQEDYEETTVYQRDSQGNESPYISESIEPEVEGVLVAAQGADNAWITAEIIEAVKALFGMEVHKIKVMKMK